MNKIIPSLITVLAIASLNLPVFAAEQMGRDSGSAVVQNPTLDWGGGAEIFGNPPTVDQYYGSASSDNHYGLAPSWGFNKESSAEVRMDNPTLQGVFENVE